MKSVRYKLITCSRVYYGNDLTTMRLCGLNSMDSFSVSNFSDFRYAYDRREILIDKMIEDELREVVRKI